MAKNGFLPLKPLLNPEEQRISVARTRFFSLNSFFPGFRQPDRCLPLKISRIEFLGKERITCRFFGLFSPGEYILQGNSTYSIYIHQTSQWVKV